MNNKYELINQDTKQFLDKLLIEIDLHNQIDHEQFFELARRACVVYNLTPTSSLDAILEATRKYILTPFGAKALRQLL